MEMMSNLTPCVVHAIRTSLSKESLQSDEMHGAKITRPPIFTTLRLNTSCGRTSESIIGELQDKINKCSKEVTVDHWCGCAVLRGADVFAQGIKGAPGSMQRGDRVSVYADIEGKCKKGLLKPYGGQKIHIGNGIAKFSRHELFVQQEKLCGVGVEMTEPTFELPSLSGILPSLVFPQNLPSAVTVHVLDPRSGERVLDICAAPGGKTTHIATLMKNTGEVFALDKTESKVEKIRENARKWNLTNIKAVAFDATKSLDPSAEFTDQPPFPAESFERVLLDGPCSALGQRPMIVNKMTSKELESYPRLQKSLFTSAVGLLKVGGTLVYSTCTVTEAENEEMVAWALNKFPTLQLSTQVPHLGGFGRQVSGLTEEDCHKLQRFNPYVGLAQKSADALQNHLHCSPQDESNNLSDNNHQVTSSGIIKAIPDSLNSAVYSARNSCGESGELSGININSVNSDTIGFFIAKFIKRLV